MFCVKYARVVGADNAVRLGGRRLQLLPGRYPEAPHVLQESLGLWRVAGDAWGISASLLHQGVLAHYQDNHERAGALYAESLARKRALGDTHGMGICLAAQALLATELGDLATARARLAESAAALREVGHKWFLAAALSVAAAWAAAAEQPQRAVRLVGAVTALNASIGGAAPARGLAARVARLVGPACQALGDTTRAGEAQTPTAWAEGQAMLLEQAVAYALEALPEGAASSTG